MLATTTDCIAIRGARVHNLKNLDLDLPRDRFIVVTGPSGSGKSSLAFDTIFAEGQRQYIESLSTYARQFIHQLERPDVDRIEGLPPTISIDQRPGAHNPRSTVATVTEIYDYLRLLYARAGEPNCFQCGAPIRQQSPEEIVEQIMALPEGTKAMILAPLVRGRKGQHAEVFAAAKKAGFVRARVDGTVHDLDALPELAPRQDHTIEAVVDRIMVRTSMQPRIAESVQLAIKHGEGLAVLTFEEAGAWRDQLFSTTFACPNCKISYEELEPRTFSFNSPYGACPTCDGLGAKRDFDIDLVLPDRQLSLLKGAIAPWRGGSSALQERRRAKLAPLVESLKVGWEEPLADWKPTAIEKVWNGDGKTLQGLKALLEEELAETTNEKLSAKLDACRSELICPDCCGARLRPEARNVRVAELAIHETTRMAVGPALVHFGQLKFSATRAPIALPLVQEIVGRLRFLIKVGLDYLTLDRAADTLSGGELQRIRLATGVGSGLVGVCYVLDEPSIGLHPRDNDRLIDALRDLQQLGNTLLIVEHDEAVMRAAEHLIDIGPGAGIHGGEIVAQGTPEEVMQSPQSITGRYLSGELRIEAARERRPVSMKRAIELEGATGNNLKDLTVRFPLGALVCVTGVSGSGKSTLVSETLARAVHRRLTGEGPKPAPHRGLRGVNQVDKFIEIDQAPIGRTPRSNPATYTGLFDEIRQVFAQTKEARLRGFKSGRFSFNVAGGRCEECQGQGLRRIEMKFLPDLFVECPSCHGKRFNDQTLQIQFKGLSIADALALSIDEAATFFESMPSMARMLASLRDVGLGYLTLGQSATTLSGGEAQRIKLAAELGRASTGHTLYILDEPTTGLHFDDVRQLLKVLHGLVDQGNSVIVIEHHLDVIKSADWLLDLGPEGGEHGGLLLAEGTPEEIARNERNETGRYLREALARL
jgi:excinuclease ABC subunit A